jgi:uncharacterized protein (TIGR00369 family)
METRQHDCRFVMGGAMITIENIEELIRACPFNVWLGMHALSVEPGRVKVLVKWREEFVSNLIRQSTHGGVLASVVDAACVYALASVSGRGASTVDLRVDYHRTARPGNLVAEASIISVGKTLATAETRIIDNDGTLVCSGRGVFFV